MLKALKHIFVVMTCFESPVKPDQSEGLVRRSNLRHSKVFSLSQNYLCNYITIGTILSESLLRHTKYLVTKNDLAQVVSSYLNN